MARRNQPPKPNAALADRLGAELTQRNIGVRRLAQRVQDCVGKDARGAKYAGVRALVAGEILRPRKEILVAIAEILQVRFGWLATGEGPRTEAEEAAAAHVAAQQQSARAPKGSVDSETGHYWLAEAILTERIPALEHVPAFIRSSLLELWGRALTAKHIRENRDFPTWPPAEAATREAAELLANTLIAPLALVNNDMGRLDRAHAPAYIMGMTQALLALLRDPQPGDFLDWSSADSRPPEQREGAPETEG